MYKIYLGSSLVFDDSDIREERFVEEPTLEMEVGKAGTLKFSVYPNHPLYNSFYKLKSYVTLMRNDEVLFKGRVLSSEDNMVGARKITVEGSLAFLNDSVIRPYDLSEFTYQRKTPAQLLEWYLTQHNAQVESTRQIALGTVTVTLPEGQYLTPSTRSYDNTLSNINKQLLDECGGYLIVRYYNGVTYLDYLSEFTTQADQTVELGKNLLDITQTVEADELATIIIPLGNDEEIEVEYVDPETGVISTQTIRRPITIVGVIDPETHEEITVDYIRNEDLIAEYGEIYKSVEFDCDLRISLYNEAKAYVDSLSMLARTIEVSALDLSRINVSLDSFRIGTNVHVKSAYHGVNDVVPVTKISLNILHPEDSQLTLGNTISSFTENNTREKNQTNKVIEKIKDDTDEEIRKVASTPMLQLSWDSVNSIAKMEQTDTDRLVQYPVTGGKIYVDCNDYSTMHNYKTVTNIPANKMMFYALYPVTDSDGDIIYHPFFAMQIITSSGIKWFDINDVLMVEEKTDILIVGDLDMVTDTTTLWSVARTLKESNDEIFMKYFASLTNINDATLEAYCEATGINNVFMKVAILEAFVNRLFANELEMTGEGLLKSTNFAEMISQVTNGVFPTAGYKLKASPDENGVQCSFFNARMAMLKAINAEFWRTTLHGIVDHDHFKTTSSGSGITSLEISTPDAYYYETELLDVLSSLARTYGYENGIYAQISEGVAYTLEGINGSYKGSSFSSIKWHKRSTEPYVSNGRLHFSVMSSRYSLKNNANLIQFTYNGSTRSSADMISKYYVSDSIWNSLNQIPENNVCDSVTGTVNINGDSMTASASDPIRIVNDGATVSFTNSQKTLSLTYCTYVDTSLYVSGISTPTSYDGIECKNIMPRDSQKVYSIGTSSKKYTVWGAVFN